MPQAIPVIYGTIKGAVFALGFSSATAAAVASFSMKAAAYWGVSKLSSALTKQKGQGAPERIASQLNLSLGEQPRELVFGRTAIGGSLMSAGNWGGEHGTDWECLVICLADHPLDALEGFWVWDQYYSFSGNGAQTAFGGGLTVHLQNATPTGAAPPEGYLGHGLVAADVAAGVTRLFVALFRQAGGGARLASQLPLGGARQALLRPPQGQHCPRRIRCAPLDQPGHLGVDGEPGPDPLQLAAGDLRRR